MSIASHASTLLAPLGFAYRAGARVRALLYYQDILHTHTLPAPVISVGNITMGGTGKTPLVRLLAQILSSEFDAPRICILSRGYGRTVVKNKLERIIVSDGVRLLADAAQGGDEPRQLAEQLLGISAVISDVDRVAAAHWAHRNLGSRLFILDDGFQHFRVRRDLDIAVVDATNPFGGGHLLPRGRLREHPTSLSRADCIVITRAEQTSELPNLIRQIEIYSNRKPIFIARTRTRALLPLAISAAHDSKNQTHIAAAANTATREKLSTDFASQSVLAFCAIGNPANFFAHLKSDGFQVCDTFTFPDHHRYTQTDVNRITRRAQANGAQALFTTSKDAVKLRDLNLTLPCFVVDIEFVIERQTQLVALMKNKLRL